MRKVHGVICGCLFVSLGAVAPTQSQTVNPPSRLISTIAGNGIQGFEGNAWLATNARLWSPYGLAFDPAGNLYLADSGSKTIRYVDPNGVLHHVAGTPNQLGFLGGGGPAISAQFQTPVGLAVDGSSNVYVADSGNNVIWKFNPTITHGISSPFIYVVAGIGTAGYSGDDGAATAAELNSPSGIAVDAIGDLYIADSGNNVIRKVSPSGQISTIAGDGTAGYSGDGGSATRAELNSPFGIALDSVGNLYIADTGNHSIREVTVGGTISTIAGNGTPGYSGNGGQATEAQLHSPDGVALDSVGNVYIADTGNQQVRVVAKNGVIAALAGVGAGGYAGDGASATAAELDMPTGLAVDGLGDVFIGDTLNNVVREVYAGTRPVVPEPSISLPPGDYAAVQYVVLTDELPNAVIHYTINGPTPTTTSPIYSFALYIGGDDTLQAIGSEPGYWNSPVATAGYDVAIPAAPAPTFSPGAGNYIGSAAVSLADAAPGATIHYTLDGSSPTTSSPVYVSPITVASTAKLTAMATAPNYRKSASVAAVYTITPTTPVPVIGPFVNTWLPNYSTPSAITITDSNPNATIYYTTDGTMPTTSSPTYAGPFFPSDWFVNYGWFLVSAFAESPGMPASPIVTQVYTIPPPIIFTVAGNGTPGDTGDGGPSTSAEVYSPSGLTIDSAGNVYFSDNAENVVRKVTPSGVISTVAGIPYVVDGRNVTAYRFGGDGGPAVSASLAYPSGLALDSVGNLYIADAGNNRIRKVAPDGIITTVAGIGQGAPGFPIPGWQGFLDNYPGYGPPPLGSYNLPSGGYTGDGQPATSEALNGPMGVAVDAAGNLFIADTQNHRIRKVDPQGIISTVAGNGQNTLYTLNLGPFNDGVIYVEYNDGSFSGDGGPATSASLSAPQGIAFDAAGNLYIADTDNNRVRMVNPKGIISTVAGVGQATYSLGDGGPAVNAQIIIPTGVAVDANGDVYIADTGDSRVRVVVPGGTIYTITGTDLSGAIAPPVFSWLVDGVPYGSNYFSYQQAFFPGGNSGFNGSNQDGNPASWIELAQPMGVAVDSQLDVVYTDNGNHLVRIADPNAVQASSWGSCYCYDWPPPNVPPFYSTPY